jgi:hypothetical protein
MSTRPETMWASLLFIAIVWALMSAAAFAASVNYGMRRLAWGWMGSFVVATLVAAYTFWMM